MTADGIENAIRVLARAAEAMSAWLLNACGRSAALMPVAQFNPVEKLDQPIVQEGGEAALQKRWDLYSGEWNGCLDGVEDDLVGESS